MTAASGNEAVRNGRQHTTYAKGMCQQYVRGPCWEVGALYASAIEAWNGARFKHPGDRTPPRGAPVYYSGGNFGHAVIATDPGRIRSTDCTSATQVNDTDIGWPERAWGYQYLGWTEDINGTTLPLRDEDDDMPLTQDEIDRIAKAVWGYVIKNLDEDDRAGEQKAATMLAQTHNRAGDARRNTS